MALLATVIFGLSGAASRCGWQRGDQCECEGERPDGGSCSDRQEHKAKRFCTVIHELTQMTFSYLSKQFRNNSKAIANNLESIKFNKN
jgi:hypothetical protein